MVLDYYLQWMRTARVSERAMAAAALAREYCEGDLGFEERCAAEAALTCILDDPSPRVRAALADALSVSRNAPMQIVASLAADQPDVAAPVLGRSPLLTDADLIDRLAGGGAIQTLIARRPVVSMNVAAAVAELGEASACLALVGNEGADIASISFRRLVERFGDRAELREALVAHPGLPSDCRHALLVKLGESFEASALVAGLLGAERVKRMLRDACQKSSLTLIESTPVQEHPALVEHLRLRGDLTAGFLVRAVAHGRVDFFGAALAGLSGRGLSRVHAVLGAGHDATLRALLRDAGLAEALHAVVLSAVRLWRDVAQSRRVAGAQEASYVMLNALGGPAAQGDLAALLRSIHLEASRANARRHALTLQAA